MGWRQWCRDGQEDSGAGGDGCASGDDAGDDRYDGVRVCGSQSDGNGEWHHHGDGEDDGDDGGVTLTAVIWGLTRYFVVTAMMTAMTEMRVW